jgi:carbon-monoxide dehydrogenase iron sulfur subunit
LNTEYQIRNRYINNLDEDAEKRVELNILHPLGPPSARYKSRVTGKAMMWHIDSSKCTGCKQCVMACSLAKTSVYSPESRIFVKRLERLGWSIPMVCEHCVEAPCAAVCPVYAISRDTDTGIVDIDLQKCIGCRLCRYACPWGKETINLTRIRGYSGFKALKCDLCGGDPACAKVCIPGAIRWVEVNEHNDVELKWTQSKTRASDIVGMDIEGCR